MEILTSIWPVTEIIFHNFDNPSVHGDLPLFLPTKNELFVDYFELMHQAVLRHDDAKQLQELCDHWVVRTKTTLAAGIQNWHHESTRVDLMDAVARIT